MNGSLHGWLNCTVGFHVRLMLSVWKTTPNPTRQWLLKIPHVYSLTCVQHDRQHFAICPQYIPLTHSRSLDTPGTWLIRSHDEWHARIILSKGSPISHWVSMCSPISHWLSPYPAWSLVWDWILLMDLDICNVPSGLLKSQTVCVSRNYLSHK